MPKRIEPEVIERILSLAEAGYYQYQIAEMTGVSRATVERYMSSNGIPAQNKRKGGAISCSMTHTTIEPDAKEVAVNAEPENDISSLIEEDRIVSFVGVNTQSRYTIRARSKYIEVVTSAADQEHAFKMTEQDLRNFAKELNDVANAYAKSHARRDI